MIQVSQNEAENDMQKTIHPFHSYNPFLEEVVEHMVETKRRKVSGWKWQEVRKGDELVKEPMLVLGDIKVVDSQEFYKVYIGEIKSFFGLSNSSMTVFEYMMTHIQYGKDKICLTAHMIKEDRKMTIPTIYRSISQLLDKKVIARADMPGCYYINPKVAFKGDRITIVRQYVKEREKGAIQDKQYMENGFRDSIVREDEEEYNKPE